MTEISGVSASDTKLGETQGQPAQSHKGTKGPSAGPPAFVKLDFLIGTKQGVQCREEAKVPSRSLSRRQNVPK
jgi:hypothetical protein